MTPQAILDHFDSGTFWPADHGVAVDGDLANAYRTAFAVRDLRIARGERVAGYKIGWTNRAAWPRMGIDGPMWGTLHDATIVASDGEADVALAGMPSPRLEPEVVVGFARAPGADPSFDELFDCLDWIAPGFEMVQTHLPDWRYTPAQTLADSAVHARLVIGAHVPVRAIAANGGALADLLARAGVRLSENGAVMTQGVGANVLDGPLHALRGFVCQMAAMPGALPIRAGDVVTTGTWTDAQPLSAGETWRAEFDAPIGALEMTLR